MLRSKNYEEQINKILIDMSILKKELKKLSGENLVLSEKVNQIIPAWRLAARVKRTKKVFANIEEYNAIRQKRIDGFVNVSLNEPTNLIKYFTLNEKYQVVDFKSNLVTNDYLEFVRDAISDTNEKLICWTYTPETGFEYNSFKEDERKEFEFFVEQRKIDGTFFNGPVLKIDTPSSDIKA